MYKQTSPIRSHARLVDLYAIIQTNIMDIKWDPDTNQNEVFGHVTSFFTQKIPLKFQSRMQNARTKI